ncbi:terpenoid synthase [Multifurca ochricompacta]|uniref:Terpene synthase n=1 Tax=Multifurca ochricompacta TaxID=376703 RepID=A0AAD4QJ26_9AGAM|nr:terpenoid synthase [Multifurca ochricompacta]
MPTRYHIPNTLETWKWPRQLNPHYIDVKEVSSAWLRSFQAFSPKAQDAYDRCDFSLLASLAYPYHNKERLRTGCDLMNVFFVFDEYSDVANGDQVQEMANIVMDALRNPHTPRPKDEWIGGEVTRQFWELAIKTASPPSQKRFIETYGAYTQSVVQQAVDRINKHIPTIQEYLQVRRNNIGATPAFAMIELEMNLPDDVVHHPAVEELSVLATDIIILGNDIVSYNVEQARGDGDYNIVTIVMHENKVDIHGAMDWLYEHHKVLEGKFMDIYENKIPRFSELVDEQLGQYVDGLGNWVRANDQWAFESERYFGKRGREIQRTRWVTLLPKQVLEEIGPQVVDDSKL